MKGKYRIHSVSYNLIMNIILKVSLVIFPLITFPYATRVLGADSYGRVGFATSVVSYFALIASLGIPSYAIRKCAQVRTNEDELSKTVKEILWINCISLIITVLCFIVLVFLVPRFRTEKELLLVCSLSIILQTFGVEWFYQSIEQYDYITLRNIGFKIVSVILLFVFVNNTADIIPYAAVTITGTVGSNILNLIRLPKIINLKKKFRLNLKQHIKPIFMLFFYYAATTIYTNLDVVMLGFMTNTSVVGFYTASVKIKTVLVSGIAAVGSVALPRASYYLAKNMKSEFNRLISTSLNLILCVSIPLAIYFSIEAKPVMIFLAGDEFENAIFSMQCIMPSIIFIGIGSITAWQLLIPLGRDKCTLVGAVVGMAVDMVINFLLIPRFGAAGASIGTVCAEISVVIVHLIGLRDIISDFFDMKNTVKIIASALICIPALLAINTFIKNKPEIMVCIITSIGYFGVYFIACSLIKEKSMGYITDKILRILKVRKNDA